MKDCVSASPKPACSHSYGKALRDGWRGAACLLPSAGEQPLLEVARLGRRRPRLLLGEILDDAHHLVARQPPEVGLHRVADPRVSHPRRRVALVVEPLLGREHLEITRDYPRLPEIARDYSHSLGGSISSSSASKNSKWEKRQWTPVVGSLVTASREEEDSHCDSAAGADVP